MKNAIAKYASLVKFAHTVFAMPFALTAFVFALVSTQTPFEWLLLVKVLLCLVLARNAAMSFNRIADKEIDRRNPRTSGREIPSGTISARAAGWFCAINCVLFVVAACWINKLAGMLSPVALVVLLGYSYTKRSTWMAHLVLGVALGIAPIGAYIAVTDAISMFPLLLAAVVVTWVGGFDIIYSLQDIDFDRAEGLHSVPARFSVGGSLIFSAVLHLISIYGVVMIGLIYLDSPLYWIGAAIFCGLLIMQHIIVTPKRLHNIPAAFGTFNGVASLVYALFSILAICNL